MGPLKLKKKERKNNHMPGIKWPVESQFEDFEERDYIVRGILNSIKLHRGK